MNENEDPLDILRRLKEEREPTTADFCWRWLMTDHPHARAYRQQIDETLKAEYGVGICDVTTRFWLDPQIMVLDSEHHQIIAGNVNQYTRMFLADNERFIGGGRVEIIEEVEDEIEWEYGEGEVADLMLALAIGEADAIFYYRGVSGRDLDQIDTAWWQLSAYSVLYAYRARRHYEEGNK